VLRVEWRISFDWTGEAQGKVDLAVGVPGHCMFPSEPLLSSPPDPSSKADLGRLLTLYGEQGIKRILTGYSPVYQRYLTTW
jgi:hypothetical protein